MEQNYRKNSINITGIISSIGEIRKNVNNKEFMYFDISQSNNNRPSYFTIYLEGDMLEEFKQKDFKKSDRIDISGKLETYNKDGKNRFHIRPDKMTKLEKQKVKEDTYEMDN